MMPYTRSHSLRTTTFCRATFRRRLCDGSVVSFSERLQKEQEQEQGPLFHYYFNINSRNVVPRIDDGYIEESTEPSS